MKKHRTPPQKNRAGHIFNLHKKQVNRLIKLIDKREREKQLLLDQLIEIELNENGRLWSF